MKNKLLLLTIITVLLIGCKSSLINYALEKKGIYDDHITTKTFSVANKQIIFLPMQHVGRKEYYDDVKRKIDSLKSKDYVFFYEKIIDDTKDTLDLYKFRKIIHFGIPKNGYVNLLDSLYKSGTKFKYTLINQPSIETFGLTSQNSFNIDMTIETIINNVEKSKDITLEQCDFINSYTQNYKCTNKLLNKEEWKKYLIDDRNDFLVNEVKKSKFKKIVVIYGKAHLNGFENQIAK
ncbi:hypothetical protein FLAN108750_09550 [Flavobacterium antarcticum]|uniref:hypothetical protein n=1 Tax=Flavobacterium antarcticum TaxID=271155 RepID=UPI0003B706E1|nr:hypothetical protein [Flavobacterium antarcticum]